MLLVVLRLFVCFSLMRMQSLTLAQRLISTKHRCKDKIKCKVSIFARDSQSLTPWPYGRQRSTGHRGTTGFRFSWQGLDTKHGPRTVLVRGVGPGVAEIRRADEEK